MEPLAIAANVAQAAHCRPDQVLLIFGFLQFRFTELQTELGDTEGTAAVLDSIERRWKKADQAIFVAAVVLNPLYRLEPFRDLDFLTTAALQRLLGELWKRFYKEDAPHELMTGIADYLNWKGRYQCMEERLKEARRMVCLLSVDLLLNTLTMLIHSADLG